MNNSGIYIIISPSNKVYVGQSVNLKHRVYKYSKLVCKSQPKLYASLSKYGWEAHLFMVVYNLPNDVSQDVLNSYEELYLQQYIDCGFEMMNVRGAGRYGKISDETKNKLKVSLKRYYENPENKEKISIATKNAMSNPEILSKMSNAKKGKKLSEDTKRKISESNSGKPREYSKINVLKAIEKNRGRVQSEEEKNKRSKSLYKKIEIEGIVYDSIKLYSEKFNIDRTNVWRRLNSTTYPNWKYINI
jgi:group I intron endonuclease